MDLSQLYFYQYLPPLLSLSVVEPLAPASFNLSEDDEGDAVCDEFVDEELLCLLDDPFNNLPNNNFLACLLYTSPSPRDATLSRMPSSA